MQKKCEYKPPSLSSCWIEPFFIYSLWENLKLGGGYFITQQHPEKLHTGWNASFKVKVEFLPSVI